jgi:DNA-binding NtrC family response regulator
MNRKDGLPVVLVIDDDVDHRLHLVSILRRNGFPCASTSPAPGALEVAARMKPNLVLARRGENETESSRLLGDVRRVLPAARVLLFVSLKDVVPASL